MAALGTTLDQSFQWAARPASLVTAVSDYATMPSVKVASTEVNDMMSVLDAQPARSVQQVENWPPGQWNTT
eukprot:8124446-Lingulodinium_polyedra.AAC.1